MSFELTARKRESEDRGSRDTGICGKDSKGKSELARQGKPRIAKIGKYREILLCKVIVTSVFQFLRPHLFGIKFECKRFYVRDDDFEKEGFSQ